MSCKIRSHGLIHALFHRLEKVAEELEGYSDVVGECHSSIHHGQLVFTRTLPSGERIAAAITQTGERELTAELAQPHAKPKEALQEVLAPILDAYHQTHTDAPLTADWNA